MWDVQTPVIGQCHACGDELNTPIRVRATAEWVERYHADERLRRSIDRAVVRLVVERHDSHCVGQEEHVHPRRSA